MALPLLAAGPLPIAEDWLQAGELGLVLLLSAVIRLDQEMRQKNASLRTHALADLGAGPSFVPRDAMRGLTTSATGGHPAPDHPGDDGKRVRHQRADDSQRRPGPGWAGRLASRSLVEAGLHVCGKRPTAELATRLSALPNVRVVTSGMLNAASRLGDGSPPAYILVDVR